jgi:hypothetical protein
LNTEPFTDISICRAVHFSYASVCTLCTGSIVWH